VIVNIKFDMEEVHFNVMNKEESEPTYLEVRYLILILIYHQG